MLILLPLRQHSKIRRVFSPTNRTYSKHKEQTGEVRHWSTALFGAETWTLRQTDQKCGAGEGLAISVKPISSEITYGQWGQEYPKYNKRRKHNWICHILRRNCLLKQVIEGKVKGRIDRTERRGRRCQQLLDDLNEQKVYLEIKCQLDTTDDFYCSSYCLPNMFQAPLCPSSGAQEYYTGGCCLWYLLLWFSSCRYGVELRVMCPVCGLLL